MRSCLCYFTCVGVSELCLSSYNLLLGVVLSRSLSRISAVLAPSKSEETEAQRSSKARLVRSTRRSTQGITNDVLEEAKRRVAPAVQPPQQQQLRSPPAATEPPKPVTQHSVVCVHSSHHFSNH